jgi:hypothetical protein
MLNSLKGVVEVGFSGGFVMELRKILIDVTAREALLMFAVIEVAATEGRGKSLYTHLPLK